MAELQLQEDERSSCLCSKLTANTSQQLFINLSCTELKETMKQRSQHAARRCCTVCCNEAVMLSMQSQIKLYAACYDDTTSGCCIRINYCLLLITSV